MKKLFALLAALLMVFTLVGCGGNDTPTTTTEPVDTVNAVMTTAPVGLHPMKTNDSPSSHLCAQMFETLYVRSYDGASYYPLLAAEMPIMSEDGLTATIKLRDDVTFQNGDKFTTEAVAYMLDAAKDPNYGHMRASIVDSIVSYEIVDDYTINLN